MDLGEADPKGLIRESYRIPGITAGECRSIFVDWALSLPPGAEIAARVDVLLAAYGDPAHPMTAVLRAGAAPPPEPRRRGGRAARVGGGD
jgi:hypothetical protein